MNISDHLFDVTGVPASQITSNHFCTIIETLVYGRTSYQESVVSVMNARDRDGPAPVELGLRNNLLHENISKVTGGSVWTQLNCMHFV